MRKVIYRFEIQSLNLCVQDSLLLVTGVFVTGGKTRSTASGSSFPLLAFNCRISVLETHV